MRFIFEIFTILLIFSNNLFAQNTYEESHKKISEKHLAYVKEYFYSQDTCFNRWERELKKDVSTKKFKLFEILAQCYQHIDLQLLRAYGFEDIFLETSHRRHEKLFSKAGNLTLRLRNGGNLDKIYDEWNTYFSEVAANISKEQISIYSDILREKYFSEDSQQNEIARQEANIPSIGSGVVFTDDGYIITNQHVVDGCSKITVEYFNRTYEAEIKSTSAKMDLAILKIDTPTIIHSKFSSRKVVKGQEVLVLGYPFGKSFSSDVKVTKGIVSSLTGIDNDTTLFQIDAAIQPGNSGGPIYNNYGEVIGITVSSIDKALFLQEFNLLPENINFGIKTRHAKDMISLLDIIYDSEFSFSSEFKSEEIISLFSESVVYIECL